MIVDPDCQARGIGSQILKVLLSEAERRGLEILGLVPTPLGRPLYDRAGFTPVGDVIGLAGVATADAFDGPTERSDSTEPLRAEALVRYDERTLGCSRDGMLRARFREAVATASSLGPDGGLSGYAMATAQGDHCVVGPVVAETEAQARALIRSLLRSVRGPVRIDVPGEHTRFREWLAAAIVCPGRCPSDLPWLPRLGARIEKRVASRGNSLNVVGPETGAF